MNFDQITIEKPHQRVKAAMSCKAMTSMTMRLSTMMFTNTAEEKLNDRELREVHHNAQKECPDAKHKKMETLVKRNRSVKVAMCCAAMLSMTMRLRTMRFTNTTKENQTEFP